MKHFGYYVHKKNCLIAEMQQIRVTFEKYFEQMDTHPDFTEIAEALRIIIIVDQNEIDKHSHLSQ